MNDLGYELRIIGREPAISAIAMFPREFVGFQGHFPARGGGEGGAILPGFMQVQLAVDVLRAAGVKAALQEVSVAKFVKAILPEVEVGIVLAEKAGRYEGRVMVGNEVCGTFEMRVSGKE